MITIIIKEVVLVKGVPPTILQNIKTDLTYDNPQFLDRMKVGAFIPKTMPRYLYYFDPFGSNSIYVPRGYMNRLLNHIKGLEYSIIDRTVAPEIDIKLTSEPRDYQKTAVAALLNHRYGVLEAPTGAGKTFCSIYLASERKVKTLVVVHNKELLDQWVAAFKQHTSIKHIGVIGTSKFKIEDVTIGIINSVSNRIEELRSIFGLLVCDECHRIAGASWVSVINSINCKYQLSVSATPFRRDGLTSVIYNLAGPLVHKIDRQLLEDTGAILVPTVVPRLTKFKYEFNNDYSSMLKSLTENRDRNIQIVNTVVEDYKKYKEPIMLVSDRVSHCETLFDLLSKDGTTKPILITGNMATEYRKNAVAALKDNRYNVLIATVSLLGEGFDAPMLSALVMGTPIKFSGRLIQIIGRILRPSNSNVQPRVYDFRDVLTKPLQFSGHHRDRLYKKAGWK